MYEEASRGGVSCGESRMVHVWREVVKDGVEEDVMDRREGDFRQQQTWLCIVV